MRTFKLNQHGDIEFNENGNISIVDDCAELLQSLKLLLSINQGEWFLKSSFGLAYSKVFGKRQWRDKAEIRDVIIQTFRQEPRIKKILSLDLDLNKETRNLIISFTIKAMNGNVIEDNIEVVW